MNDKNENTEMSPTHEATHGLRFVERIVPAPELGNYTGRKVRILQQMYVPKKLAYARYGVARRAA